MGLDVSGEALCLLRISSLSPPVLQTSLYRRSFERLDMGMSRTSTVCREAYSKNFLSVEESMNDKSYVRCQALCTKSCLG